MRFNLVLIKNEELERRTKKERNNFTEPEGRDATYSHHSQEWNEEWNPPFISSKVVIHVSIDILKTYMRTGSTL